MTSKIIYLISLMSLILVCQAGINKRPSWAIGRSVEYADEPSSNEHFELVKKPSWAIGRDLSEQEQENTDFDKRLIEFKRFIEYKKDLDESDMINFISKLGRKDKRPSIGARTRSLSRNS